jgi:hypothetical protein
MISATSEGGKKGCLRRLEFLRQPTVQDFHDGLYLIAFGPRLTVRYIEIVRIAGKDSRAGTAFGLSSATA